MYNYDNEYTGPQFESGNEFNMESENDFETQGFQNEMDYNNEFGYEQEYDNEEEYSLNQEYDMEQPYETESDFENEFNNWQNEVTVHDHRQQAAMASVGRSPGVVRVPTIPGRSVNSPFSSIGRTPLSTRPANQTAYYRRIAAPLGRSYFQNRYLNPLSYRFPIKWGTRPSVTYNNTYTTNYRNPYRPWYNRFPRYYGWNTGYQNPLPSYGAPAMAMPEQSAGSSAPQSGSSFNPDVIFDSIKNLSQQIAATNASVEALGRSISSQDHGAPAKAPDEAPQPASPSFTAAPPPGQPGESEFDMEDYEYDMESEMFDHENGGYEMRETELAAELLATNNEQELDHFLSSIINGLGKVVNGIAGSAQGKMLRKLLSGVVRKALPMAGAAAGGFFGGPVGARIGQQLGSSLSSGQSVIPNIFGLELEGLSNEDSEYEVARAIVRLADDAARELEENPPTGDPAQDARKALINAAVRHAPGLLVQKKDKAVGNGYDDWYR